MFGHNHCTICDNSYSGKNTALTCEHCNHSVCSKCQKQYCRDTCMHCRIRFSRRYLKSILGIKFVRDNLDPQSIILEMVQQKQQLIYAQSIAEWEDQCEIIKTENRRRFKHKDMPDKPASTSSGMGIVTIPCPSTICRGYITIVDTNTGKLLTTKGSCPMCTHTVCCTCQQSVCEEATVEQQHVCDVGILQNLAILATTTKPCPCCSTRIYKIDGCNEMMCTNCNTHFLWNTLGIIKSRANERHHHYLVNTEEKKGTNQHIIDRTSNLTPYSPYTALSTAVNKHTSWEKQVAEDDVAAMLREPSLTEDRINLNVFRDKLNEFIKMCYKSPASIELEKLMSYTNTASFKEARYYFWKHIFTDTHQFWLYSIPEIIREFILQQELTVDKQSLKLQEAHEANQVRFIRGQLSEKTWTHRVFTLNVQTEYNLAIFDLLNQYLMRAYKWQSRIYNNPYHLFTPFGESQKLMFDNMLSELQTTIDDINVRLLNSFHERLETGKYLHIDTSFNPTNVIGYRQLKPAAPKSFNPENIQPIDESDVKPQIDMYTEAITTVFQKREYAYDTETLLTYVDKINAVFKCANKFRHLVVITNNKLLWQKQSRLIRNAEFTTEILGKIDVIGTKFTQPISGYLTRLDMDSLQFYHTDKWLQMVDEGTMLVMDIQIINSFNTTNALVELTYPISGVEYKTPPTLPEIFYHEQIYIESKSCASSPPTQNDPRSLSRLFMLNSSPDDIILDKAAVFILTVMSPLRLQLYPFQVCYYRIIFWAILQIITGAVSKTVFKYYPYMENMLNPIYRKIVPDGVPASVLIDIIKGSINALSVVCGVQVSQITSSSSIKPTVLFRNLFLKVSVEDYLLSCKSSTPSEIPLTTCCSTQMNMILNGNMTEMVNLCKFDIGKSIPEPPPPLVMGILICSQDYTATQWAQTLEHWNPITVISTDNMTTCNSKITDFKNGKSRLLIINGRQLIGTTFVTDTGTTERRRYVCIAIRPSQTNHIIKYLLPFIFKTSNPPPEYCPTVMYIPCMIESSGFEHYHWFDNGSVNLVREQNYGIQHQHITQQIRMLTSID